MIRVICLTAEKPRSGMNSETGHQDRPLQEADWTESCEGRSQLHISGIRALQAEGPMGAGEEQRPPSWRAMNRGHRRVMG